MRRQYVEYKRSGCYEKGIKHKKAFLENKNFID